MANDATPTNPGSSDSEPSGSDRRPVQLTSGLPSTVLPEPDAQLRHRLAQARSASDPAVAIAAVIADHPRWSEAWAALGDVAGETIARYAAYRVGYHRGLDALRANGWRGSGFVRWSAPGNLGFLRSLAGLQAMAAAIGEHDEAERCAHFLLQLDPSGVPVDETIRGG